MRVLAAMSGGVDSAVAAARAVDAGHDVVGVHLALSETPDALRSGSRGCCSREDAADARRAADVIGIPFYVWDFAARFREDVVDDFVAEYAAGRTPNPCLRCNEKIKFSAVLDRALALGFEAVATGHHARLADGELRRSVDGISQRMLTVTLRSLERDGIVHRTLYPEIPPRVEYGLTALGKTLLEAISTFVRWAEMHVDEINAARAEYDAREGQGNGATG